MGTKERIREGKGKEEEMRRSGKGKFGDWTGVGDGISDGRGGFESRLDNHDEDRIDTPNLKAGMMTEL